MKNVFKLLFFVIYIIAIFSLKNYRILGIYIIINLVISKMLNAKFLAFLASVPTNITSNLKQPNKAKDRIIAKVRLDIS